MPTFQNKNPEGANTRILGVFRKYLIINEKYDFMLSNEDSWFAKGFLSELKKAVFGIKMGKNDVSTMIFSLRGCNFSAFAFLFRDFF